MPRSLPRLLPPSRGNIMNCERLAALPQFQPDHTKANFEIFQRTGFRPVFFGDALIGPRLRSLTYINGQRHRTQRDDLRAAVFGDPQWEKLSSSPVFKSEPVVSNVTNLILNPASLSQI